MASNISLPCSSSQLTNQTNSDSGMASQSSFSPEILINFGSTPSQRTTQPIVDLPIEVVENGSVSANATASKSSSDETIVENTAVKRQEMEEEEQLGDKCEFSVMTCIASELRDPIPLAPGKCTLRPLDKLIPMKVLYAKAPNEIYVQLSPNDHVLNVIGNSHEHLTKLMLKLYGNSVRSQAPKIDPGFLYPEMAIAAYFDDLSGFRRWYRGVIKEIDYSGDIVRLKVFFVDFGNTETVTINEIRHLHRSVADIQIIINCVRLADYEQPADLSPEMLKEHMTVFHKRMSQLLINCKGKADIMVQFLRADSWLGDNYRIYPVKLFTVNNVEISPKLIFSDVEFSSLRTTAQPSAAVPTPPRRRIEIASPVCVIQPAPVVARLPDAIASTSGNGNPPPQPTTSMIIDSVPQLSHNSSTQSVRNSLPAGGELYCKVVIVEVLESGGRMASSLITDGRPIFYDGDTRIDKHAYGMDYSVVRDSPVFKGAVCDANIVRKGELYYCTKMTPAELHEPNVTLKQATVMVVTQQYAIATTPAADLVLVMPWALQYHPTHAVLAVGLAEDLGELEKMCLRCPPSWLVPGMNVELETTPCPREIARSVMKCHFSILAISITPFTNILRGIALVDRECTHGYVLNPSTIINEVDGNDVTEEILLPTNVLPTLSDGTKLAPDTPLDIRACQELRERDFKWRVFSCTIIGNQVTVPSNNLLSSLPVEEESTLELVPVAGDSLQPERLPEFNSCLLDLSGETPRSLIKPIAIRSRPTTASPSHNIAHVTSVIVAGGALLTPPVDNATGCEPAVHAPVITDNSGNACDSAASMIPTPPDEMDLLPVELAALAPGESLYEEGDIWYELCGGGGDKAGGALIVQTNQPAPVVITPQMSLIDTKNKHHCVFCGFNGDGFRSRKALWLHIQTSHPKIEDLDGDTSDSDFEDQHDLNSQVFNAKNGVVNVNVENMIAAPPAKPKDAFFDDIVENLKCQLKQKPQRFSCSPNE